MRPNHAMRTRPGWWTGILGMWLATQVVGVPIPGWGAEPLEYNRDIRPILAEHCFKCHGPDSAARKGDLRLDQRDAALAADAWVPGKPDASEALRRIVSTDPDEVMPPPNQPQRVTAAQRERLRQWIAAGAQYQAHWSFLPPARPQVPTVRQQGWVRQPLDAFVLARLEAAGLTPAPEADRRTLARRLSLDLRGVPPTPEEAAAFAADTRPDYYERFVDQLLESRQWGEHRARYWLDAARYADTHGIHFDNYRENWAYRDWVIGAFNRNLPFDQFTREQLAGDLLPNRTLEQQIASGFNRCNITTNEGGIIDEEYLVLYTRDRTETLAQVWLGLTMNCTTCHDHKFDPIQQREFYELAAFFNNTTQAAKDGNIKDTPPTVIVPQMPDAESAVRLPEQIAATRLRQETRRKEARATFDTWLASARPEEVLGEVRSEGLAAHLPLSEGKGKETQIRLASETRQLPLTDSAKWTEGVAGGQGLLLQGTAVEVPDLGEFDHSQPLTLAAWIKVSPNDTQGAVFARMEDPPGHRGWDLWVQARRVGMHLIHRWPDDALKVVGKQQIKGNTWTHVAVTYDGSDKTAGVRLYYDGQLQEVNVEQDTLRNTTRSSVPFKLGQRHSGEPLSGAGVADVRIYSRALAAAEISALAKGSQYAALLARPAAERSDSEKNELYSWWLETRDPQYQQETSKLAQLEQELNAIKSRGTVALVMQERSEPAMAFVLFRGEYDKRREQVTPDTPDILPSFPAALPRNRLGLADWLLRSDQPLVTRVTVNRFWQELFGSGLVRTSGDFGVAGELPSHPELLDWLAVDFRERGWDVKQFFKQLVTSATYRQAAMTTPEKLERDPQNRLLSRGPRFRLDAEVVRDYALAASGLLVTKIGGPSVRPYQPEGVWEAVAMIGSNTRDYRQDSGESLYRRSMYTFWKRSAPPASLDIFNAPSREVCVVRRERTNTPLQALVTLNDPQFVEAARHLAQRTLREHGESEDAGLQSLAQRLLARSFRPAELAIARESLAGLRAYYEGHPDDARAVLKVGESPVDSSLAAAKLAAWTMLANELLNLDEVLNK